MEKGRYEIHHILESRFPFIFYKEVFFNDYSIPNWHENIEILCCIKGNGILKYRTNDYSFSAGDVSVINSDTLHTVLADSEIAYYFLIIDTSFFQQNDLPMEGIYFQELINDPNIFAAFLKIADAFSEEGPLQKAMIKHRVLDLLLKLYEHYTVEKSADLLNPESTKRIKDAIQYIKKNITSKLTLDMIAESVNINKYYLAHEFKKHTNSTVFEHINLLRCQEAKYLIENGMSVSAAALSCGFENVSYFTKVYKKYMGSLPSETAAK